MHSAKGQKPEKDCWQIFVGSEKWAFVKVMLWMKSQWIVLACPQSLRHPLSTEQLRGWRLRIFVFSFIAAAWLLALFINVTSTLNCSIFTEHHNRTVTLCRCSPLAKQLTWRYPEPLLIPTFLLLATFLCLLNMWGKEAIYFEAVII